MDWAALATSMEADLSARRTASAVVDTPASSEVISPVALTRLVALLNDNGSEAEDTNTNLTNVYNQLVIVNANLVALNTTLTSGINVTIVT